MLHFVQLLSGQFFPPEGGQYEYFPIRKITNKIEHICFYVYRGRILESTIFKILELNSTQDLLRNKKFWWKLKNQESF